MKNEYIAEIGWNFMGDMELAASMISAASVSGATHAKFQYWNPSKLRKGPWDQDGRRQIYENAQLSEEKIAQLCKLCEEHGLIFLVSVFNQEDAELVSKISAEAIKIPSHEVANKKLIEFSLENFNKVYISLGACSKEEFKWVSDLVNKTRPGDKDVVIMHCVSSYPCDTSKINLGRIDFISAHFNNTLGFSDHTQSDLVPSLAVMKGVSVIEKHFTTDHDLPGRDNKFAVLPDQFKTLVHNCEEAVLAQIDHGIEAQDIEMDTVNNYRGRWG